MSAREIVLIGQADSGKTHYAAQLYGRLRRTTGALRIREEQGTPVDLSPLEGAFRAISEGRLADHTASSVWSELRLPLYDPRGNPIDLHWPDYGGEQVNEMLRRRAVTASWQERLRRAEGWVWMIRPHVERTSPVDLSKLAQKPAEGASGVDRASRWDANATLVELLQILLHVAGLGTVARVRRPRLAVLLSCYDEIQQSTTPRETLWSRLPLVASFIESNWVVGEASVWGVSALGRALRRDKPDEDFADLPPEGHGWVIAPDGGAQRADLGLPLAWLLGAAS